WTVLPFSESVLTVDRRKERGWRHARYIFHLENRSNVPASYTIEARADDTRDDAHKLALDLDGHSASLDPGGRADIRVLVTAPVHTIGVAQKHTFNVEAAAKGEPAQAARAEFVQRALLPVWAALVPLALIGLAVFLLGKHPVVGLDPPSIPFDPQEVGSS